MALVLALALASAALLIILLLLAGATVTTTMPYFNKLRCCFGCEAVPSDDLEGCPTTAKITDLPDPNSAAEAAAPRQLGWRQIESLTRSFTSPVIGEGGSSTVYLAVLPNSSTAALKIIRASERLHRAFRLELDVLLRVRHRNIVRLLGFCDDCEEGVLVFEFVPNGSLHEKLHGNGGEVLSWARRITIAYQLAAAMEYLHEGCDPQIVHGDIKASNVLLDEELDPKLCDFGSARVGFSAAIQRRSANPMVGSPGYVDPHYLRTGILSKKSDVYSFGVLVLELITGIEAFHSEREQMLTAVVGPLLRDAVTGNLVEMVDPRLRGEFDADEVTEMISVAALCVVAQPSLRPSMGEVLRVMKEKVPSALISAVGSKSNAKEGL